MHDPRQTVAHPWFNAPACVYNLTRYLRRAERVDGDVGQGKAAPAVTLPYGPVMATAGAAVLAKTCGLGILTVPLLALAIAQAVWIAVTAAARQRAPLRHPLSWLATVRHPREHSGVHTVPLGIAIISGGLAGFTAAGSNLVSPPWAIGSCLALTWLTAAICITRFTAALTLRPWEWNDVDGAWFLVPAAALGVAVATVEVVTGTPVAWHAPLRGLALVAGALGWLGYWWVAAAAAHRVRRHGLGSAPRAPWWIAMGCAGLAAAAMGKLLDTAAWPTAIGVALKAALLIAAISAVVLMVPVAVLGARFLLRDCRYRNRAAWPPTFSTAVFALGCLAAGAAWSSRIFWVLGLAGTYATLVFWAVTAGWNTLRALRGWRPRT